MANRPSGVPRSLPLLFSALVLLSLLWTPGCATSRTTRTDLRLGDQTIRVQVFQHGNPTPTMINVHDDENTSVRAGRRVVKESGGRIIELRHDGHRHVTFNLDGATHGFDPNRIFSEAGVRTTLARRGNATEAAIAAVQDFANQLLREFNLESEPVIIALHNTGGQGLSIQSYLPGHRLEEVAAKVHVSERRYRGDFFYVTDDRFFRYLSTQNFNVILQAPADSPDDGSLSFYFARRGIPYINVEADLAHLGEQTEMLRIVVRMLTDLGLLPPR